MCLQLIYHTQGEKYHSRFNVIGKFICISTMLLHFAFAGESLRFIHCMVHLMMFL